MNRAEKKTTLLPAPNEKRAEAIRKLKFENFKINNPIPPPVSQFVPDKEFVCVNIHTKHRRNDSGKSVSFATPIDVVIKEQENVITTESVEFEDLQSGEDKLSVADVEWEDGLIMQLPRVETSLPHHYDSIIRQFMNDDRCEVQDNQTSISWETQDKTRVICQVNQADRIRTYRSMTTKGSIKCKAVPDLHTRFVVDSGAAVSMISGRVWRQMGYNNSALFKKGLLQFANASGSNMPSLGLTKIRFSMGQEEFQAFVFVVEDLAPDMILGNDFLHSVGAVIDYGAREIRFAYARAIGITISNQTDTPEMPNTIRVIERTILPARSHMVITSTCDVPDQREVIISAPPRSRHRHVHVKTSLSKMMEGKVICHLTNTGTKDITLHPGHVVGTYKAEGTIPCETC